MQSSHKVSGKKSHAPQIRVIKTPERILRQSRIESSQLQSRELHQSRPAAMRQSAGGVFVQSPVFGAGSGRNISRMSNEVVVSFQKSKRSTMPKAKSKTDRGVDSRMACWRRPSTRFAAGDRRQLPATLPADNRRRAADRFPL